MSSRTNFCALPFHHVMVRTDGSFWPCCVHRTPQPHLQNINVSSWRTWHNGKYLQEVRESFLRDEQHPGCHHCWHQERSGVVSLRQRQEREFAILGIDTESRHLTNVEIDLGNLCNLKCLMCDEYNSSAILAENTRLGVNQITQKDIDWSEQAFQHVKEMLDAGPRVVNIRGGEPFYNKKLLQLITEIPDRTASNMCLHITTNATTWSTSWQQALSRFRLVRIMFSIDAVEDLYEYIRYPAKWPWVEQQVDDIVQQPNVKAMVHCVVQNLNIAYLPQLINWCRDRDLYLEFDLIQQPDFLQIFNLSDSDRVRAIASLRQALDNLGSDHTAKFLQGCISMLGQHCHDPVLWQKFLHHVQPRDRVRQRSFTKFMEVPC